MENTENRESLNSFHTMLWEVATEETKKELVEIFGEKEDKGLDGQIQFIPKSDTKTLDPIKFMLQKEGHTVPNDNEEGDKKLESIIRVINIIHNSFSRKVVIEEIPKLDLTASEATILICHIFSNKTPQTSKQTIFNMIISTPIGIEPQRLIDIKPSFSHREASMILSYTSIHNTPLAPNVQGVLKGIIDTTRTIIDEIKECTTTEQIMQKINRIETEDQAVAILSSPVIGIYYDKSGLTSNGQDINGYPVTPDDQRVDIQNSEKGKMKAIQIQLMELIKNKNNAERVRDSRNLLPSRDKNNQHNTWYVSNELISYINGIADL